MEAAKLAEVLLKQGLSLEMVLGEVRKLLRKHLKLSQTRLVGLEAILPQKLETLQIKLVMAEE